MKTLLKTRFFKNFVPLFSIAMLIASCNTEPKLSATADEPSDMINLVKWLGSINDLTDIAFVANGLHLKPNIIKLEYEKDGKLLPSAANVFDQAPLRMNPNIIISYYLSEPHSPAALYFPAKSFETRATLRIDYKNRSNCLSYQDMLKNFGEPNFRGLASDGGGGGGLWFIYDSPTRKTYFSGGLPNPPGCIDNIFVQQGVLVSPK